MIHRKDFDAALNSVRAEGRAIDDVAAHEAVERMSASYQGDAKKFKQLRDTVLKRMCEQGYFTNDTLRSYELLLGRNFNPRAVAAVRRDPEKRKGPWIPQVLEANVEHVLLQVNPEFKMDFKPLEKCREKPKLDWRDIRYQKQPPTGNSDVPDALFRVAKRKALAILNQKRLPVPQKV